MTPFDLHDKTIFITGGSSGIGQAIAVAVSKMGGKVIITGRNSERLGQTLSLLEGSGHQSIIADLLIVADRAMLVDKIPPVNGVVHSAGIVQLLPMKFLTQQKVNQTLSIDYEAPALLMAGISRQKKLLAGGSVVFLSSIAAQHPYTGGALYAGAKAALEAFSKVVAIELSLMGIRSNCISPAMVKTPLFDGAQKEVGTEVMNNHIAQYPLGVGHPEDVANAAVFLLSDASRWITGTNMILDGGYLLGK